MLSVEGTDRDESCTLIAPCRGQGQFNLVLNSLIPEEICGLNRPVASGSAQLDHVTASGWIADRQNDKIVSVAQEDNVVERVEKALIDIARKVQGAAPDGDNACAAHDDGTEATGNAGVAEMRVSIF
jgi:hypothetical protein